MRINEALNLIHNEKLISFHMPGHKNGRLLSSYFSDWMGYDITEISGADNLHEPTSCIKESEGKLANYHQSIESHIIVNGSTAGLYAAIGSICSPGDELIIMRESHRAVYSAMMLAGIVGHYIFPRIDSTFGVPLPVELDQIKEIVKRYPNSKGIVLTSPNYYGIMCNIREIGEWLHKKDMILIVDEAHGAHLRLHPALPDSAVTCGADLVVQSYHKTLPALTQSAVIHINTVRIDRKKVRQLLQIHQTSSPSYLIMMSVDAALDIAINRGEDLMSQLLSYIKVFSKEIEKHPFLDLLKPLSQGIISDPTRLVLVDRSPYRVDYNRLEDTLRKDFHIQIEYSYSQGIVLIPTIANTGEDFKSLLNALFSIDFEELSNIREYDTIGYEHPKVAFTLRDAFYISKEDVELYNAVGRVSGEFIIPYPPGVPLIVPGEIISLQLLERINQLSRFGTQIIGIQNGRIDVLKEDKC
jgi:arginine/lysine/ornithine decarboxylase